MVNYYVAHQSKTHAFLMERRMAAERISCELTYMPREIMSDQCNLGVKFAECEYARAVKVIKNSGIPGVKLYMEVVNPHNASYYQVNY